MLLLSIYPYRIVPARLLTMYLQGLLIMLGSSILSDMKHLHTLRLLHDPTCAKDAVNPTRPLENDSQLEDVSALDPEPSTSHPTSNTHLTGE